MTGASANASKRAGDHLGTASSLAQPHKWKGTRTGTGTGTHTRTHTRARTHGSWSILKGILPGILSKILPGILPKILPKNPKLSTCSTSDLTDFGGTSHTLDTFEGR